MKILGSLLAAQVLVCMAFTGSQASAQDSTSSAGDFPASELSKLPYLYFDNNNLGESILFRMRQQDSTIEINGKRYIGFQFWSTGLVEWLFVNTEGELEPGTWLLVNQQGEQVDSSEPQDLPLTDCPRISARFPEASRVAHYRTQGEALETRGRYHLLQEVTNDQPQPYAVCLASLSPESYEARQDGQLIRKISEPLLRQSTDVVIANMKELRRDEGVKAATEYLEEEFHVRMDDYENASNLPSVNQSQARRGFTGLYINAWREGQVGGGRLDSGWASEVYGVMYEVCLERGHFSRLDVVNNLTSSLSSAGRFGKLAEVSESWEEGMRLGGYRIDPTTYPDRGPAFSVLPQVRKRDIPHLGPYSLAEEKGIKTQSHPTGLSTNLVGCFQNYSSHLWYQGNWRDSLEWLEWAHRWASDPQSGDPASLYKGYVWHGTLAQMAERLASLGFREQALTFHQDALKQEITGGYEGKYTVWHQMNSLELQRLMGRKLSEDSVVQARAFIKRSAGNLYDKRETVLSYKAELAELLIYLGRLSEGEALLDELAAEGSRSARIARLKHWVNIGRVAGVEAELLQLLEQSRETGRKMDEIEFYRLYADFLQQQGRLGEALWVRRELVRLCRAFDLFTHLPVEMAKLAALLNLTGNRIEGLELANQARKLLGEGRLPAHLASKALGILDGMIGSTEVEESDSAIRVEFQPLRSIIIPLKGAPWTSHITLANPSDTDHAGTLRATGLPVRFQEVESNVDILATLGGSEGAEELNVRIEPASYKIIALGAADTFTTNGELSLSWTPDDGEYLTESHIELKQTSEGATTAIIQAGAYQLNPFYGIPVYHNYVDAEGAGKSQPMRFVSNQQARIEIYDMDGTPIAIDAQGNGSLRNPGDDLFGTGDGNGNLLLPLNAGSTSFMMLVYPQKELPEDGLSLRIECLEGNEWTLYASDHLMPVQKED